ncbi:MAG: FxsA family protein [Sporolactobacillus sp.]
MLRKLIIGTLCFLILEISSLILVAHLIHIGYTVLLLMIDVLLGLFIIWREGLLFIRQLRDSLYARRLPGEPLLHGLCLLVGALLLICPGFFSDVLSLLFLVPQFRYRIVRKIKFWLQFQLRRKNFSFIRFRRE